MLAAINEFVAWAINYYWHLNNVPMFNTYVILELWLIGSACRLYIHNSLIKRLILMGMIALTIYWLLDVIVNGIVLFKNGIFVAISLFYVVCFLTLLISKSIFSQKKIYLQPLFILAVATILYFAAIIPFFGLMNYLTTNDMSLAIKLFKINIAAAILRYALVAIAFYLYGNQAKGVHVT